MAALNYRANAPLVDNMLKEIGLVDKENGSLEDLLTGNHNLIKQSVIKAPTNDPVNKSDSDIG
nr:Band 7 protein [Moritella viscosa]